MREIKFRGLDISGGVWHYGFLTIPEVGEYAGRSFISNRAGMPLAFEVRPETVGQLIGQHDKEGTQVYEADIYQEDWKGETITGVITYHKGYCRFMINDGPFIHYGDIKYTGQILGNIYENPELAEEK